jgi:transposase
MNSPPVQQPRFVGLDVHKSHTVFAAVDAQQNIVLPPRRVYRDEFEAWIRKNLRSTDRLVLEATTNAWHVYDQLEPFVTSVTVAHPLLGARDFLGFAT